MCALNRMSFANRLEVFALSVPFLHSLTIPLTCFVVAFFLAGNHLRKMKTKMRNGNIDDTEGVNKKVIDKFSHHLSPPIQLFLLRDSQQNESSTTTAKAPSI